MTGFVSKSKQIGAHEITVRRLDMSKGRALLVRLASVIAPALGDAISKGADLRSVAKIAQGDVIGGSLLRGLGDRFDDATIEYVAHTLGTVSEAKNEAGVVLKLEKSDMRDMVFNGDYLAFFEWLAFGLEVQYRDFFQGLVARVAGAQPETQLTASP